MSRSNQDPGSTGPYIWDLDGSSLVGILSNDPKDPGSVNRVIENRCKS